MKSRVYALGARVWRIVTAPMLAYLGRLPVRSNRVLYESFAGSGFLCNPEAIFRGLTAAPDFTGMEHIWVLNRNARATERPPGVKVVRYRSIGYFHALATSRYLVNNATFPPEFVKRHDQVYVNTWHGTPLKKMGYDMPDGAAESANTLRNFVSADYLLSQNDFMTRTMYRDAYKLSGAFRGTVIEAGYPRVDRQFQLDRAEARGVLRSAGLRLDDRIVVLYAPTWSGARFSSPERNLRQLLDITGELQTMLGDSEYVVLLKPHQVIHQGQATDSTGRVVPNRIPTNTVLAAADVLITDYSSIFFDFLVSERPVVFFRPPSALDSAAPEWGVVRGEYFESADLPGPVCATVSQLSDAIVGAYQDHDSAQRRAAWRARFGPADDGNATERVIDIVFRAKADSPYSRTIDGDRRTSVLLHLGSMNTNGITSSALNLVRALDHSRYNVSVVFNRPTTLQQWDNQRRIDPRVRQFHRVGRMQATPLNQFRRRLGEITGRLASGSDLGGRNGMWDREWRRCFGDVTFDRVIDFDGYGPFWAALLLHSPPAIRSVWLHNQMQAETRRLIRGRRRLRLSLRAVFRLYQAFDALVSVSPALADVNRATLAVAHGVDPERFVSARNVIEPDRILQLAQESLDGVLGDPRSPVRAGLDPADSTIWFVTLGRFSTEKNQERLVRAFARVHASFATSRLLLIGYGPLRAHLLSLIEELDLTESAYIVGPLQNPFPLLAAADCFVLSSDYEGQPMVLMEAAVLALPIVTVAFDTIADSLPFDEVVVVERTVSGLVDGMERFLGKPHRPPTVDFERYVRDVLDEFEAATSLQAVDSR